MHLNEYQFELDSNIFNSNPFPNYACLDIKKRQIQWLKIQNVKKLII